MSILEINLLASQEAQHLVVQAVILPEILGFVPMAEVPSFYLVDDLVIDCIQQLRRRVVRMDVEHLVDDFAGAGVREHVVDAMTSCVPSMETIQSLHAFSSTRDFLWPPADAGLPMGLVDRIRSTYDEEVLAGELENLSAHEVEDVVGDAMDVSAMPFRDGQPSDPVVVLMVAIQPEERERLLLQPRQPVTVRLVLVPEETEIAEHDDVILPSHPLLLGEADRAEPRDVDRDVRIARQVDHNIASFQLSPFFNSSCPDWASGNDQSAF